MLVNPRIAKELPHVSIRMSIILQLLPKTLFGLKKDVPRESRIKRRRYVVYELWKAKEAAKGKRINITPIVVLFLELPQRR